MGSTTVAGVWSLRDDGFATSSVIGCADPERLALPPERADDEPHAGPWLDDPAYEVGAFLLGLGDASR